MRRALVVVALALVALLGWLALWPRDDDAGRQPAGRRSTALGESPEAAVVRRHAEAVAAEASTQASDEEIPRGELDATGAEDDWWPEQRPNRARRGTLRGVVLDPVGEPVDGAFVRLVSTWLPDEAADAEELRADVTAKFASQTHTQADGTFTVNYVGGETLRLTVDPPDSRSDALLSWWNRFVEPGATLTVRLAERASTRLAGTVRSNVTASGIAGARVRLQWKHANGGNLSRELTTGAAGEWSYEFDEQGTRTEGSQPEILPATGWVDIAVDAPAHERTTVLFEVVPGENRRDLELDRGVAVTVTVVDADSGLPIAGADVGTWAPWRQGPTLATTDTEGRATAERLLYDRGYVRSLGVSAEEYATSTVSYGPFYEDGGAREIEVPLRAPATLSWRCMDDRGKPIENALIVVRSGQPYTPERPRGAGRVRGLTMTSARSDDAGNASVTGIAPGKRPVEVSFFLEGVLARKEEADGLGPREHRHAGEVVLTRGAPLDGRVLLHDGTPARGAWVVLARRKDGRMDMGTLTNESVQPSAGSYAYVDQEGAFEVAGLAPGIWDALAWGPDLPAIVIREIEMPADGTPVPLEIRLPAGVTLRGRVVDADGAPVVGAEVAVLRDQPLEFNFLYGATTDEDGAFAFPGFRADDVDVWVEVEVRDAEGNVNEPGRYVTPSAGPVTLELPRLQEFDPDEHDRIRGR